MINQPAMEIHSKHLPDFYQIDELDVGENKSLLSFFLSIIKATAIFFVITVIVFFVVNYPFIRSQIVDWQKAKSGIDYNEYVLPERRLPEKRK